MTHPLPWLAGEAGDTSTDVRSPTSTDVRSPTSTRAYTADNFTATVTGGAGDGATTVNIYPINRARAQAGAVGDAPSSAPSSSAGLGAIVVAGAIFLAVVLEADELHFLTKRGG